MPQDTFTLRLVAKELDGALRGGKINKINQPEKEELSFLIYTGKGTVKLTVNANAGDCGVYFTEDRQENPLVAPNFCMLLRKDLTGAQILSVSLDGFERILILKLYCPSDFSCCERELRCEIMGKYSNVILTENGIILGAMKTTALDENFRRTILPGAKYLPPARQDKVDPSDKAALRRLFSTPPEGELSRFLFSRVAGLAPVTAERIAADFAGGDLAEYVYSTIFSDEISPCVLEREGVPVDFSARSVAGAKHFETLSAAQSYFYAKKRAIKRLEGERRRLSAAVSAQKKKQEKKLAGIAEKLREAASAEENRVKGELLTANLYVLSRGMKSCELPDFYDESGKTRKIALDETLSPAQNAQNYFKKYRKQKRALEFLRPQEAEAREEIDYLESVLAQIGAASAIEDLRSAEEELIVAKILKAPQSGSGKGGAGKKTGRETEISFRRFERGGFCILSGRNNLQNDRLLRESDPDDLWLHTQKYHSSHVLVKARKQTVPEEVIGFAASVCVRYSDAKGGGKVPVDYCKARFVKKPRGAKAGFVVYSDYQTVLAEPLPENERESGET